MKVRKAVPESVMLNEVKHLAWEENWLRVRGIVLLRGPDPSLRSG
jgi:hypothetical protein